MSAGALTEISVAVDGEAAEAVHELFERHGGGAVVEVRVADPVHDDPGGLGATTWLRTYVPADDPGARLRVEVGLWHLSQIHPIPEAVVREVAEADWAEAWKAHFTPLHLPGGFVVVPAWIDPAEAGARPGEHVVRLDPGMAFGTGLHPTTQLCLAALADHVRPGARVLDAGTGSGILAIAAARLGAAYVRGVDIDARAIDSARANAALNGVAIDFDAGGVTPPAASAPFDVVVANILAPTVVALATVLAAHLRPGGVLIASGILAEQADGVAAAMQAAGCGPPARRAAGDWVALVARRAAAHGADAAGPPA
ncbi:50S ribosomal protein L11 methyltransferase [bacterium]|nr:MAG: 50S ribosomal protein L11 methyltransferase [bacterium]